MKSDLSPSSRQVVDSSLQADTSSKASVSDKFGRKDEPRLLRRERSRRNLKSEIVFWDRFTDRTSRCLGIFFVCFYLYLCGWISNIFTFSVPFLFIAFFVSLFFLVNFSRLKQFREYWSINSFDGIFSKYWCVHPLDDYFALRNIYAADKIQLANVTPPFCDPTLVEKVRSLLRSWFFSLLSEGKMDYRNVSNSLAEYQGSFLMAIPPKKAFLTIFFRAPRSCRSEVPLNPF